MEEDFWAVDLNPPIREALVLCRQLTAMGWYHAWHWVIGPRGDTRWIIWKPGGYGSGTGPDMVTGLKQAMAEAGLHAAAH